MSGAAGRLLMIAALMSARQYAKHRGVSHKAVQRAVPAGRIPSAGSRLPTVPELAPRAQR